MKLINYEHLIINLNLKQTFTLPLHLRANQLYAQGFRNNLLRLHRHHFIAHWNF